jgi:hypothetical protein
MVNKYCLKHTLNPELRINCGKELSELQINELLYLFYFSFSINYKTIYINIGCTFAVFKTLQSKNINNARKTKQKNPIQNELPCNPGARSGMTE